MMDMLNKVKVDAATFRIAALATVVLLLLLTTGAASAATITVDDSGGADYSTIQAAVNNAGSGDVIQVAAGMYYEHVVVNK
jgi:nitrous oxidase accessory protein